MGVIETVRCYNPGPRIEDSFYFTIIPPDKDLNNVSWWKMEAPKDCFFEVPRDIEVMSRTYTVPLKTDVLRRYEQRGVMVIDGKPESVEEGEGVKAAKAKFKAYCEEVAQKHIDQCQQCRMNNMPPVPATGFTRTALIEAGYFDPADAYAQALKGVSNDTYTAKQAKETQDSMISQISELQNQLAQLTVAARNPKDPRNRAPDTNMGLEAGKNDAKANPGEGDAPAGDRKGRARR